MDVNRIEQQVNMLAGSLHMRMDYNRLAQMNAGTLKLLIVEGKTDERFISSHICDDVICMVANKAFGNSNGLDPKQIVKCKDAIIKVVFGLSRIPTLIKCPKGSENWRVFGMIDKDFDENNSYTNTPRLFITDTHDLETLMLSTEPDLLQKIESCVIEAEDAKKAIFMAYQLGKMRQLLSDIISKKVWSAGNWEVEYSVFFNEDYRISLKDLIAYLIPYHNKTVEDKNDIISSSKEKKLFSQLSNDKSIKKMLANDGTWRSGIESFDSSEINDLWDIVNGHDLLSLLRYVNQDAALRFRNTSGFSLNREFEMALIDVYNTENFKKTKICSRMVEENIVKA